MDASETLLPLFLTSLAVGACALAGARHLGRSHGLWPGSWGCLLLAASFVLLAPAIPWLGPLAELPAALFPLWLLAGAFDYTGAPRPRWLGPASLLVPIGRFALAVAGPPGSSSWLALACEPAAAAAAARVVQRGIRARAPLPERLLAPALAALALFLAANHLRLALDPQAGVSWWLWLLFGGGTAAVQIAAGLAEAWSQRRAAHRVLLSHQDRLRMILASLGTSTAVLIDREGRIQPVLDEIPPQPGRYGFGHARVPGRPLRDFLPGGEGERVLSEVQRVFETREPRELAARVALPNGVFDFEVSLRPVAGAGGVDAVLALASDVTERRRAEASSAALAVQLQRAQKLESLGVMAGGIAHDFNNLLVAILCSADLAEAELREGGDALPFVEDVRRAGGRAAELTQQLLAYTGKAQRSIEEVELGALVQDLARVLRARLPVQTRLVLRDDGSAPRVRVDATQLRQVVLNLVINASEALREGAGTVQILIGTLPPEAAAESASPAPPRYAFLEVRDDGCGMDGATRERIFDPFFTTKFQGRGLGLAAVQGIVRSHAGRILVESAPGEGTRIRIELPALPEAEPAAA